MNEKIKNFFLLIKRELVWKDFEIFKIFHIKKIILLRLNMVVFIKVLVRLFIKRAELNPYKMPKKNITTSEKSVWRKQIFFKRNF